MEFRILQREGVSGESVHLPDLLLPDLFFSDRFLGGEIASETALRWAVFADGVRQYWRMAADLASHDSDEFREEESWILADDSVWPFSFLNLCKTFGLEIESTRAALIAWKQTHLPEAARPQRDRIFSQA
jgi:hypothetical protein